MKIVDDENEQHKVTTKEVIYTQQFQRVNTFLNIRSQSLSESAFNTQEAD